MERSKRKRRKRERDSEEGWEEALPRPEQGISHVLVQVWPPHIHRLTAGGQQAQWSLGRQP